MNELTKAKLRIKRLEKCLSDVTGLLFNRAVELNANGRDNEECPEYRMLQQINGRIDRTMRKPRGAYGRSSIR
jgi:hypothetical protein